jgi:hypothetical protein
MKNKLLLSLWLLGAVLYTGSSVFLANTLLGGVGGHADKAKPTIFAAADAQCQKASSSDGGDKSAKTASVQPQKPEPAEKPAEAAAPASHSTPPAPTGAAQEPSRRGPSSEDTQDADASASDGAPPPDGGPQEEASVPDGADGAGPDQPERDEWARVVASTADMRSDPSRDAALIYALPSGWQVRVISRSNGWVQIQDANSGAAGWVEASALAPVAPGEQQGQSYDGYPPRDGPGYGPPPRYADEGYPPDPRWRPRYGQFADFLRRALGGY